MKIFSGGSELKLIKGTDRVGKNDVNYCYTSGGNIASIGMLDYNKSTCGIDPVMGFLTAEGVYHSVERAFKDHDFVIVEGSQCTGAWVRNFSKMFGTEHYFMFHLNLSYEDNFRRLKLRQFTKNKEAFSEEGIIESIYVPLSDKNYNNVIQKIRQYNTLFEKYGEGLKALQVDATLSAEKVTKKIVSFINNNL